MDIKQILSELEFFASLKDDEIEDVALHADILDFNSDEILFYENEQKDRFYYLLDGELKFYRVDRFDNEIFLYRLTCNQMVTDFIDVSDLTHRKCFANAVFTKKSQMLSIEYDFFVNTLQKNIILYKSFVKEATKRMQKLENVINRDVVFDGTAKVACMIVNNLLHVNELKKHEIAYELHIQPETLSRILAKMVRNKLISVEKNRVSVLDEKSLKEIYT